DVVIKATKVDGVYDSDPKINPDTVKFHQLSYMDAVSRRLSVMDTTALTLCMENDIPILVLNLWEPETLIRGIQGEPVGTLVSND
ncbi:MAG TPA: UMP kinase, partial [Anaerolineaceae bacterium]|nr:UMP kinase [Anaerolineaceae bacterium]